MVYIMQQVVYIMQCVCASDSVGVWCGQQVVYITQCVCVHTLDNVHVGVVCTQGGLHLTGCVYSKGLTQQAA